MTGGSSKISLRDYNGIFDFMTNGIRKGNLIQHQYNPEYRIKIIGIKAASHILPEAENKLHIKTAAVFPLLPLPLSHSRYIFSEYVATEVDIKR